MHSAFFYEKVYKSRTYFYPQTMTIEMFVQEVRKISQNTFVENVELLFYFDTHEPELNWNFDAWNSLNYFDSIQYRHRINGSNN